MVIIIELPLRRRADLLVETIMRILNLPALPLLVAAGDATQCRVDPPCARASAGNASIGAIYLTITDNGPTD